MKGQSYNQQRKNAYRERQLDCVAFLDINGIASAIEAARLLTRHKGIPIRLHGQDVYIGNTRSWVLTMVYDASPYVLTEACRIAGASIAFALD